MVTFRKRLHFSGRVARAYLTVASQAALVLENLRLIERPGGRGVEGEFSSNVRGWRGRYMTHWHRDSPASSPASPLPS